MKVCIAGGGKVGMYLAQSLLARLEARATVRFTPNSRFAIWQATRLFSSAPVTATKASQLATSAVRMVSKLMACWPIRWISR